MGEMFRGGRGGGGGGGGARPNEHAVDAVSEMLYARPWRKLLDTVVQPAIAACWGDNNWPYVIWHRCYYMYT